MGRREEVVARAYQHLGEDYYSMNYSDPDGYADGTGTHYVGAGWGCAQFVACCFNTTTGTSYLGSVWNYAGDALGQGVSQGGGEWYFVDEPEAGDAVIYIAAGHNGLDYDDYGHIALYVGDGTVVGAMGRGTPGEARYLNIGISETTVAAQDIGGGWRYIRCSRLDRQDPPRPTIENLGVGAVYRFFDPTNGDHFFTADHGEAVAVGGWKNYEGMPFRVPATGETVWRVYNPGNGDHLLTRNAVEVLSTLDAGWRYEGFAFPSGGSIPVYRYYDGKFHFYVVDGEEKRVVSEYMKFEGIAFYAERLD